MREVSRRVASYAATSTVILRFRCSSRRPSRSPALLECAARGYALELAAPVTI